MKLSNTLLGLQSSTSPNSIAICNCTFDTPKSSFNQRIKLASSSNSTANIAKEVEMDSKTFTNNVQNKTNDFLEEVAGQFDQIRSQLDQIEYQAESTSFYKSQHVGDRAALGYINDYLECDSRIAVVGDQLHELGDINRHYPLEEYLNDRLKELKIQLKFVGKRRDEVRSFFLERGYATEQQLATGFFPQDQQPPVFQKPSLAEVEGEENQEKQPKEQEMEELQKERLEN